MSGIKLNVKGIDKVIAEFSRFDKDTRVAVRAAVKKSADSIRKEAQTRIPVDTGEMKKRIRTKFSSDGLSAEIAPRSSLAHLVEFGTAKTRAQPFMTPTAEAEIPKYEKAMEEAVKKAVSKL